MDFERSFELCYFPISYFTNLKVNWECDYTSNYLFEIESSKRTAEWLEYQLNDLGENCLYNKEVEANTIIYRFTWLRSFDPPVAIRLEKIDNEIILYWKVGKGSGGYKPEGLKKEGHKKLSLKEWIAFERLITESNFENLPNEKFVLITDGATWTLEERTFDRFKAHHTNSPSKGISIACMYLLDLTNIKIKEGDKY